MESFREHGAFLWSWEPGSRLSPCELPHQEGIGFSAAGHSWRPSKPFPLAIVDCQWSENRRGPGARQPLQPPCSQLPPDFRADGH
jgi:hypothetical protein